MRTENQSNGCAHDHAQIFCAHGLIHAHRKTRVIGVRMAMCTSKPIIGKDASRTPEMDPSDPPNCPWLICQGLTWTVFNRQYSYWILHRGDDQSLFWFEIIIYFDICVVFVCLCTVYWIGCRLLWKSDFPSAPSLPVRSMKIWIRI